LHLQNFAALNDVVPLIDNTDLFAGVSTGGLISLALVFGLDLNAIKNFYLENCKEIFRDTLCDDLKDFFGLAGADYEIKNLERVLIRIFGNARLSDLKRSVLVTAFDLDNKAPDPMKRSWVPLIMSNLPGNYYGNDLFLYEAGCSTAAAPIFFNPYTGPHVDGYIDGGITNSNASVSAFTTATKALSKDAQRKKEDILLLNVGTGVSLRFLEGDDLDPGYLTWMKNIIPAMMDGNDLAADGQCRDLLGDNYFRIAPVFPHGVNVAMDAVDKLDYLLRFADEVDIEPALKWLKEKWIKNNNSGVN